MSELDDSSTTDQADTNVEQTTNTETGQEGTDGADYNSNDALDGLDDSALAEVQEIGESLNDAGVTPGSGDGPVGAPATPPVESGGDGDSPARGLSPDQDGPQR